MSRGIGPVLLTHFTPDDTGVISDDDPQATEAAESADDSSPGRPMTKSGVLVAPAPRGRSARHRAGRGRRARVLTKQPTRDGKARHNTSPKNTTPKNEEADGTTAADDKLASTAPLPAPAGLRWYSSTRTLRVVGLAGGALVLLCFGLGFANASHELTGTATAASTPNNPDGMQPGVLPNAALAGVPTTTTTAPPTSSKPPATEVHHAPVRAAAPPPPPPSQTPWTQAMTATMPQPGQPCAKPGQFTIDAQYRPAECVIDPTNGQATWQQW